SRIGSLPDGAAGVASCAKVEETPCVAAMVAPPAATASRSTSRRERLNTGSIMGKVLPAGPLRVNGSIAGCLRNSARICPLSPAVGGHPLSGRGSDACRNRRHGRIERRGDDVAKLIDARPVLG